MSESDQKVAQDGEEASISAGESLRRAVAGGRLMDGIAGEVLITLFAFLFAFILGALLIAFTDNDVLAKFSFFGSAPGAALGAAWDKVITAYGALIQGCVGSPAALAETTAQAAPLIFAGLGVALAFRVGLFNIGGQGQAIWGAIGAGYVGFTFHLPAYIHLPLAVLAGLATGALWAGIAGVLRARFGAHEVIVTIMLNYVASGLLLWLLNTDLFRDPLRRDPISSPVSTSSMLPAISGRFNSGFLLALLAAVAVWWILDHTKLGFSIRAVGANGDAAETAGMNGKTTLTLAMVIAGILCGMAGVQVILAPTVLNEPMRLTAGLVGNVGFNAITVALLGRSRPVGVVLAGLLFGALQAGGMKMQTNAQTPYELANVIQALIVMFVAAPMLVRTLVPFLKARKNPPVVHHAASVTEAEVAA